MADDLLPNVDRFARSRREGPVALGDADNAQVLPGVQRAAERARRQQSTGFAQSIRRLPFDDPDREAENRRISRETGLPLGQVKQQPDLARSRAAELRDGTSLSSAPGISAWLMEDPDNAALARDDIQSLTAVERLFRNSPRASREQSTWVDDLAAGTLQMRQSGIGLLTVAPGLLDVASGTYGEALAEDAATRLDNLNVQIEETRRDIRDRSQRGKRAENERRMAELVAQRNQLRLMVGEGGPEARAEEAVREADAGAEAVVQGVVEIAGLMAEVAELPTDERADAAMNPENTWEEALLGFIAAPGVTTRQVALRSVPAMLPVIAASAGGQAVAGPVGAAAAGGSAGAATEFGASLAQGLAETLVDRGIDPTDQDAVLSALSQDPTIFSDALSDARVRSAIIGGFDAVSGAILGRLAQGGATVAGTVARGTAGALAEGASEGAGEAAAQLATEGEITPSEVIAETIGGLAIGAPMTGTQMVAEASRVRREASRYSRAGTTQAHLEEVSRNAQESALRRRDPERYEAAMEAAGPDTSVFISAEVVREYFQSKDVDAQEVLEAWGVDASEWQEAVSSGGDIVVSESVYAARIAGTDDDAWFQANATRDEDEMSAAEAALFNEQVREVLETERQLQADLEAEARDIRQADVQIREDMVSQLRAAGRSPEVAQREAALWSAFMVTRAERTGQDALDLARSMPVEVRGPNDQPIPRRRTQIDAMLNTLRRQGDRALRPRGVGVVDFVRGLGPIDDRGGELAALDAPSGLIAREGGRGLDEVGRALIEAGYFPEYMGGAELQADGTRVDEAAVALEAISEALSGNDRFPQGQGPDADMVALSEALSERGIDIATATNDEIVAALNAGEEREFGQGQEARRGSIQFPAGGVDTGTSVINLFEGADLSTFTHEAGHFFLEAFTATATDADQADLATVRDFLGAQEGEAYTTEQHEKWARAFEAYLMEGKAPSLDLAEVFSRVRAWMMRVYQTMRGLNVEVTPEVREVMDRMLATDAEIAIAHEAAGDAAMFGERPPGMSEQDYQSYVRLSRRNEVRASDRLRAKTMEKVRRETKAWWKRERAAVVKEVEAEINQQPVYRLFEAAANGVWLGNDDAEIGDMRIDRIALVERYGEGILSEIGKTSVGGKRAVYTEGGMDLEVAAEFFGFESANQMVEALQNAGKRKEVIQKEADRRMAERHGDPLNDGTVEAEALDAIRTRQSGDRKIREARYLAERSGRSTKGMTTRFYRQRAQAMLGNMSVAQAMRPRSFLRNERKAARASQEAFAKVSRGGGASALAEALQAKEQQILNGYLFDEASKLEALFKAKREKMRTFDNRKVREKIGQGYIEQIDGLLEQYEFRQRSGPQIARAESLRDFVQRMTEAGRASELNISDKLMDEAKRQHYTKLSVSEFQGLIDTVENLEHLGRTKGQLIEAKRKRELNASLDEMIETLLEYRGPVDVDDRSTALSFLNTFRRPDLMISSLDNGEEMGAFYDHLKRGIDEGVALEQKMGAEQAKRMDDLFTKHYSKSEVRAMSKPVKVNDGGKREWTKAQILSIALNTGNEANFQRLMDQNVWADSVMTPERLDTLLGTMDERDWRFVVDMWKEIDSLWPELSAVHQRRTGAEPKKVQPKIMVDAPSFVTGGYYPISYDPKRGAKAAKDEASGFDDWSRLGWGGTQQVANGMTRQREATGGGRTLDFDLSVAFRHVRETTRYITMSEAVDNAAKLLRHPRLVEAMQSVGQSNTQQALELWLADVARGPINNTDLTSKFVRSVRVNFTLSRLGLNLKTIMLQATGVTQSAAVIGTRAMLRGAASYLRNPRAAVQDVTARSALMAERQTTFQRDLYDFLNDTTSEGPVAGRLTKARTATAKVTFWPMIKMQFLSVDMPTWLGAYDAEMQRSGDEAKAVHYADRMVVRAQDSGFISDRSAIERGTLNPTTRQSEIMKLYSTLAGYMITKSNRVQMSLLKGRKGVREAEGATDAIAAVLNAATDLMLLLAGEAVVMGAAYALLSDEDETPEEVAAFILKETGLAFTGGIPLARDVASAFSGFQPSTPVEEVATLPYDLFTQVSQGELDRALARVAADGVGLATGLPTTQAMRIGDFLMEPGERTPAEALFGRNPLQD